MGRAAPGYRVLDARVHCFHLTNTVERLCATAMSRFATMGGDAACSEITLGNLVLVNVDKSGVSVDSHVVYTIIKPITLDETSIYSFITVGIRSGVSVELVWMR